MLPTAKESPNFLRCEHLAAPVTFQGFPLTKTRLRVPSPSAYVLGLKLGASHPRFGSCGLIALHESPGIGVGSLFKLFGHFEGWKSSFVRYSCQQKNCPTSSAGNPLLSKSTPYAR